MPACHSLPDYLLTVLCGPVTWLLLESEMTTPPEWLQQESVSCTPSLLSALLHSPLSYPIGCYTKDIVVKSSFQIWGQSRWHVGLLAAPLSVPLIQNPLFLTSLSTKCFYCGMTWVSKHWKSFMWTKLMVPGKKQKTFFRYLQMRNFAKGFSAH